MASTIKRQGTKRSLKKQLELTPGEQLFLWRKRLKINQAKAAKIHNCSVFNYQKAEYDNPVEGFKYTTIISNPYDHEKCVIYRKRANKLQREIAVAIGVSRYWLNRQEKGAEDCSKLLAFWESA